MKKKKVILDEINYVIFSEIYMKHTSLKSQRKAFSFLEVATRLMNRKGFDNITLAMVAKESGVTAPSVRYYYSSADDLKITTAKFIRLKFQKFVLRGMLNKDKPKDILSSYIERCFLWVEQNREDANVWLSVLAQCVRDKKLREMNHAAVEVGRERIESIIRKGILSRTFRSDNPTHTSKVIQVLITGGLVCYASQSHDDDKEYKTLIKEKCFQLLK